MKQKTTRQAEVFFKLRTAVAVIYAVTTTLGLRSANADTTISASDLPVVAAEGVRASEVRAFAQAHERKTLSEALLRARPGVAAANDLRNKLQRAQALWLEGSIDAAKAAFKELAAFAGESDWSRAQAKAIQYAQLRLAQSTQSETERDKWLNQAASRFSYVEPEAGVFPPPLLEHYRRIESEMRKSAVNVSFSHLTDEVRFVVIDGRAIDLLSTTRTQVMPGDHRVAYYTDFAMPLTKAMSAKQIAGDRPKLAYAARGNCVDPEVSQSSLNKGDFDLLFAEGCVRQINGGNLQPRNPTTALNLAIHRTNENGLPEMSTLHETRDPFDSQKVTRPSYRWLWITAGVLAAGYVAQREFNRDRGSAEPSAASTEKRSVHHDKF